MAASAITAAVDGQAPASLHALLERFDADAFDAPSGSARIRLTVRDKGSWDALIGSGALRLEDAGTRPPDATIVADAATWDRVRTDVTAGMDAYRRRALHVRHNLHLGVGFLVATSGMTGPGRPRFRTLRTRLGALSVLEAGQGAPVLLLHGLGATKISFLPTLSALGAQRRLIAIDLPGFGDSDKPLRARYDPPFFARWAAAALDALSIDRCDVVGHSLGGRVALELAFQSGDRVDRLVLMTPSLAWLRDRRWARYLRLVRPELGLIQPAPRRITEAVVRRLVPDARGEGWAAAGVDEFLRGYLNPRGRAAFYAAARHIYLEDPEAFWARLEKLAPEALFIWGRRDPVVPKGFMRHVERALPEARHVELDCGHVPQLERPDEVHAAIEDFLMAARPAATALSS